jgi:hypothetical protein
MSRASKVKSPVSSTQKSASAPMRIAPFFGNSPWKRAGRSAQ